MGQEPATRYFLAMRLKFSRMSFVAWRESMRLEVLLRALLEGFERFGGVPWVLVFDNMKTVTLGRDEAGRPIWHPVFEKFAEELDCKPECCAKGRGNQKGSVENLVGWVKSSFLAAREFLDDADLARPSEEWVEGANSRVSQAHGEVPREVWEEERPHLTPLTTTASDYGLFGLVSPNPEGVVRLRGERYMVPIGYAGSSLVVRLRRDRVDFYDGDERVARHARPEHPRSRRSPPLFEPEFLEPLLRERPRARVMVYRDYLNQQHPAIARYLHRLCRRHRGDENFGPHILGMFRWLRQEGCAELAAACALAEAEGAYGVEYLEGLLQRPRPRPVGQKLELEGVPLQREVERSLETCEAYAMRGGEWDA